MIYIYPGLFRRVLLPAYETVLRRRKTLHYLREYEQSQWLPPEQVEALQWQKLQRLVRHCWEQVPYYRERWQPLGISAPDDIASPADYARLPALQKPEIRANFEKLIARDHHEGLLYKATGGSTGEPLRFGYTRESYERRLAIMWRGYGWAGAHLGQRTAYLWGTPMGTQDRKDRLYHAAFNRRMLNAFEMSEEQMAGFADALNRYRPETIVGYVSPLVRLAEWLIATGAHMHRPGRILGAAEALHENQRRILEEAFGCSVFNTYGCREFMLIAAECKCRSGLHVNADHLSVELDRPAPGCEADSPRDLIITDLHNYGMPLLRYANGDMASTGDVNCKCGMGLPLLASVNGRRLDMIRTREGRYLPGEFFPHLFKDFVKIRKFQVIQKSLDSILIKRVPADLFEVVDEMNIRREISKALDADTAIEIRYVDKIDLTESGKFRVTISELQ